MHLSTQLDYTYFLEQIGPTEVPISPTVKMNIKVYPTWFICVRLEWEPLESWVDKNPRYNVYTSEAYASGYIKLTSSPTTNTFLVDDSTWLSSKFEEEWWIIEAITDIGTFRSEPVSTRAKRGTFQNNRAVEINRREWILLNKFSGMDATIMRPITHGQRCPVCWDKVSRKVVGNKCVNCYNTGFTDGYFDGMHTKIQFDARVENQQMSYFGKFEANQIGAWTIAYPDIQAGDLIIRHGDQKVYKVEQIQNTELLGSTVRQIMRLTELAKQGVEYALIDREGLREVDVKNGLDLHMGLPYE